MPQALWFTSCRLDYRIYSSYAAARLHPLWNNGRKWLSTFSCWNNDPI